MTLDIIIPHYKEPQQVIKKLLASIDLQQGVDLSSVTVIIVNDGNEVVLSDAFLNSFENIKIKYFIKEHEGVSAARNYGIAQATADFIMFCDADDMFFDSCGLWVIFNELYNYPQDVDILSAAFYVELQKQGYSAMDLSKNNQPNSAEFASLLASIQANNNLKTIYLDSFASCFNNTFNDLFIHGKVFRRQFIVENKLTFPTSLKINEDKYFTDLAFLLAKYVITIKKPFYMWYNNPTSVSRTVSANNVGVLLELALGEDTIKSGVLELSKLYELNKYDLCSQRAYSLLFSFYALLVGYPLIITENAAAYMFNITLALAKNITFLDKLIALTDFDASTIQQNVIIQHRISPGLYEDKLATISFEDWTQKLREIAKQQADK